MIDIKQGDTVTAASQGGKVTGEILRVNNRKVTIQVKEKEISEAGQRMTIYTNEEIRIMDHKITEVVN